MHLRKQDMSKGISWRQRSILKSILRAKDGVIAWKDVDYGPTDSEGEADYQSARVQWNLEQSVRRALRSLERRGLVKLNRYCFSDDIAGGPFPHITHSAIHPANHVPGETRIWTGVVLTEAGREIAGEPK
jgi:hypothetical protein